MTVISPYVTFTYFTLTQGQAPGPPVRYLNLPNPNHESKPPGPPVRDVNNLPYPNPNLLFIIGHDVYDHLKIGLIRVLKNLS